jgi:hypothetical protein
MAIPLTVSMRIWSHKLVTMGNIGIIVILSGMVLLIALVILAVYTAQVVRVHKLKSDIDKRVVLGKTFDDPNVTYLPVDLVKLEKYLLDALNELRQNLGIVTGTFYSKSLADQLKEFPTYTVVLTFVKYMLDTNQVAKNTIHDILVKHYGADYKKSPLLVYNVPSKIDKFKSITFKHSLLTDIGKAFTVYKKNKVAIDQILK